MSNKERLLQVLVAPHLSEKTLTVSSHDAPQVTFRVACDASKVEIKEAVEFIFDVKVQAVSTANVKGKRKRFGRVEGRRSDWKKAYVTLEAGTDLSGADLDFLGSE